MSRAIANELYAQGVLLKHIAEHLGVSHQRVSQLITVPRRGRGNTGGQNPALSRRIVPVEVSQPSVIAPDARGGWPPRNDDGDGSAKPEDMRSQVKLGKSVQETIDTLRANGFQYATAGDSRRLIEEIGRLRECVRINALRAGFEHEHVDAVLYREPGFTR